MTQIFKQKPALSIVVAAVVLVILGLLVIFLTHPHSMLSPDAAPLTGIQSLPTAQVASAFPSNVPWETDTQILQNFQATTASGKTQSTRVYLSKLTAVGNFVLFQKYFADNGWKITSSVNQPNIKGLNATKDSASMNITIAQDSNGQVTVNVSYLD